MNDYIGADGLLYCGKCNTPRQCRITMFGKEDIVFQNCDCAKERYNAKCERVKWNTRACRITEMRSEGFADAALLHCTFAFDDGAMPEITDICKKYVDSFDSFLDRGEGLLFHGLCGSGKTFYASCIANAVVEKGYPALVTSFKQIISRPLDEQARTIDALNRYALLVLDDLGTERRSESGYMQEMIYTIVDKRVRSGLPMIVTTNLSMDEIKHPKEIDYKRIYDRIMEKTVPVEVNGMNQRYRKINETIGKFREMLGISEM